MLRIEALAATSATPLQGGTVRSTSTGCVFLQADVAAQLQPSHGVVAGEDAKLRIATYPVDEPAADLCLDARVSNW